MLDKDLLNLLLETQTMDSAAVTADADAAEVDMKGYNSVMFLVNVGATGDTLDGSNYIELEVLESDTSGSGYTAAADADVRDTVTGTNTGTFALINAGTEDDTLYKCQYTGSMRYPIVRVNVTGTHTNGTPIGIIAIQAGAQILPAA